MKKLAYILGAALLLTLPSCRFISVSEEAKEELKNNFSMNGESSGERIIASDNYITRNDVTGEFSALECNLPGDVIYTPGDCAVSIYAPDNILDIVTVRNQNGTLEIKTNTSRIRNLKHVKINISSPVLENVVFNGAVDFNAPQGITALDFRATVNGAGDIDINGLQSSKAALIVNGAGDATISGIDCDDLQVAIAGAGDAIVSGRVSGKANLSISGAGDIDARELQCTDIDTKVRGVGSVKRPK
ncbi:MAG: DUF2807 domain-containing protein [Bacteroidales bacterium]|jgi:hypothetical protein|nr:DUF2807 domain-containing protein [Bacteroidales bacterium]MDY6443579.1 DUF2807 domain-containing protein [Bacteroidales bacterium]